MEHSNTVQTAIVDAALAETRITDEDVLAELCDVHVGATRAACLSFESAGDSMDDARQTLDFDEYLAVGRAL